MPWFTLSFCTLIVVIYILDCFILIPQDKAVTLKEKLLTGHNKGYINRALHLSCEKIRRGQVWRLVSSSLLHIGTWHIVSNTVAIFIVGCAVESALGTAKALICYAVSALFSGLFMAFVYKLPEGEGASPGIYGMIAVFAVLAVKNGTVMFSDLPVYAVVILGLYTVAGLFGDRATVCEHISGLTGGLLIGLLLTC